MSDNGIVSRIWKIADAVYSQFVDQHGEPVDLPKLKEAVITICEATGINRATATTQWYKWKKSKGL